MESIKNPEPIDFYSLENTILLSDLINSFNSSLRDYPVMWNLLVYINSDDNRPNPGVEPPYNFYLEEIRSDIDRVFNGDDDDENFKFNQCQILNIDPVSLIDKLMQDSWVL